MRDMLRTVVRVLPAGSAGLFTLAVAGCNLIFGVTGGEGSGVGGGAGGSAGSSSSAMCLPYAGTGTTYFTDVGTANLPTVMMGNYQSVSGTYDSAAGYTELKLGAGVPGYCDIGTIVDLAGMPQVGPYTVVGASPYTDVTFTEGPPNKAYVFGSATVQLPDGGCADQVLGFGSIAGSGTVSVTSVQGTKVAFTVTGVNAAGINDPMCAGMGVPCDGQGTIQIDIKGGESDCFATQ